MSDYQEEENFETSFNGQTLIRIFRLALVNWPFLLFFLIFIAATGILEAYIPMTMRTLIDEGIGARDWEAFRQATIRIIITMGIMALTVPGFIISAGLMGDRMQYQLRKKLFDHLQTLSFSYFDKTPVGWIMARCTSDVGRLADLVTWNLLDVTWSVAHIITASVFMFLINTKLALIVLASLPVVITIAIRFRVVIIKEFRKVRSLNSRITGRFNENITGVKIVKALVRERKNLSLFGALLGDMYNASFRAAWLSALFLPIIQMITAVAMALVVWFGSGDVRAGGLTIGGLQAFVMYITFILWPVQELARIFAEAQRSIASAERVFSLLDAQPEIVNSQAAEHRGHFKGDIVFDHVTFYYSKDNPVLNDFSLHIAPGEKIALVGPTGGGKSTIVNLACRFYEPKSGRILIDDEDYSGYTLESIHDRIAVVLQTPHLFSGTIRENILYGRLDANENEVEEAARIAHAHEFIAKLPRGYDEEVGEGGSLLSVGEKQLISLARAILRQPDIIVMDEATSSIDTLTEELIQKGMANLASDATCFFIAHRLSTIRNADRIIYIEKGRIQEEGTHHELLRQKGLYYKLYTRQYQSEKMHTMSDF